MRPYQCGISVYQLAKLQMLEFYYDFLDYYFDRRDFELRQLAWSGENIDELNKPELREEYHNGGKLSFYLHLSAMTELQVCLNKSFREQE